MEIQYCRKAGNSAQSITTCLVLKWQDQDSSSSLSDYQPVKVPMSAFWVAYLVGDQIRMAILGLGSEWQQELEWLTGTLSVGASING